VPWQPGPDGPNGEPWWWDMVKSAGGAVLGGLINRLIDKLLEEKAPAIVYRVVSVCETDAQGEPISQSREVAIPQLPVLDGLLARMDAMDVLMQGLKDFKQPICEPELQQAPTGRTINVRWRSEEASPYSGDRLRKLFRYRDQTGKDLSLHTEHWKDFHWLSGSWMVISTGLSWGKPQVWAGSEAEGKRVLAHAAQIAGVDLSSSKHKWVVREVTGLRANPVLRMRVDRSAQGTPWVTERDGPTGLPEGSAQLTSTLGSRLDDESAQM
jgi:hypothetical protein